MEITAVLVIAVCIVYTAIGSVDAQITFSPLEASVSLGKQFNFTLVSTEQLTSDKIIFRRITPPFNLCTWNMFTQKVDRNEPGYGCGTTDVANTYYFVILKVTRKDSGIYTAQYGIMKTNTSTLDVRFPPTVEIKPVSPCVPPTYVEGQKNVSLNCTVTSANPAPSTFKWYHKNRLVGDGQIYNISTVTRSSRGRYNCTAENGEAPHGEATIRVKVHYKPNITSSGIVNKEQQRRVTVAEGDKVIFLCQADSFPPPDMTIWSAGRIENQTQQHISVSYTPGSPDCYDRGNYTCSARNILGEVISDNTELLVKCLPRQLNPESSPLIATADLDEDADFQFDVVAHPKSNFSLKSTKGTQLDYDVNIVWDGLVASGTFTLYKIKMEQFGSYILTVNNTEGSRDFSVILREKSSPDKPQNLQVTDVSTQSLSIAWEEGFNGGAEQNFTVEYRRTDGQWITHPHVLSEDDILELDLRGLHPDTRYEIRIKACNQYGSSNYTDVSERTSGMKMSLGLGAGIGVAVMVGIVGVTLVIVFICRRKRAGRVLGNQDSQGTVRFQAAVDTIQVNNAEDKAYMI